MPDEIKVGEFGHIPISIQSHTRHTTSPWHSGYGRRIHFVGQHLSGAGSSPAGSVGRDLNLQKLNYQYLTTSVAVVLVVR